MLVMLVIVPEVIVTDPDEMVAVIVPEMATVGVPEMVTLGVPDIETLPVIVTVPLTVPMLTVPDEIVTAPEIVTVPETVPTLTVPLTVTVPEIEETVTVPETVTDPVTVTVPVIVPMVTVPAVICTFGCPRGVGGVSGTLSVPSYHVAVRNEGCPVGAVAGPFGACWKTTLTGDPFSGTA